MHPSSSTYELHVREKLIDLGLVILKLAEWEKHGLIKQPANTEIKGFLGTLIDVDRCLSNSIDFERSMRKILSQTEIDLLQARSELSDMQKEIKKYEQILESMV